MQQSTSNTEPDHGGPGEFWFRGVHGTGVRQYADLREEPTKLHSGTWAVITEFDGPWHAWQVDSIHRCDGKYTCVTPITSPGAAASWRAPQPDEWVSNLDRGTYLAGVGTIHRLIDEGELTQVNLCRILSTPLPSPPPAREIFQRLDSRHPAPYAGWFDFPSGPGPRAWVVSASPELGYEISNGLLRVSPIKGTARTAEELLAKDYEENRLVTEALRQQLAAFFAETKVVSSCRVEQHPGLVQLVSTIEGRVPRPQLTPGMWDDALGLLNPPLSVVGVPKHRALETITALEPSRRGPYCGAVGWIDADEGECLMGAMIRSFWWEDGYLRFGTGAGITRDSEPRVEWEETRLKAERLLRILAEMSP